MVRRPPQAPPEKPHAGRVGLVGWASQRRCEAALERGREGYASCHSLCGRVPRVHFSQGRGAAWRTARLTCLRSGLNDRALRPATPHRARPALHNARRGNGADSRRGGRVFASILLARSCNIRASAPTTHRRPALVRRALALNVCASTWLASHTCREYRHSRALPGSACHGHRQRASSTYLGTPAITAAGAVVYAGAHGALGPTWCDRAVQRGAAGALPRSGVPACAAEGSAAARAAPPRRPCGAAR